MSIGESQERLRAQIWKAIAKGELDLTSVPKSDLEQLVDLTVQAALMEIDEELGRTIPENAGDRSEQIGNDEEKILWEGRPFLSISERYVVTNERVRVFKGLFSKEREDVELIRIQDIDQKQTLRERLLSVGDVSIRSHDSSHPLIVLNNVKDPQAVHEIIRRAVLNARKQQGLIYREEM